jgi:hypothetical protein
MMSSTRKDSKANDSVLPVATTPGNLYDRDGPIPVPEVRELNTESVWALFQDAKPLDEGDGAPPPFDDTSYGDTAAAPLKP